jgi:hypothetical protein
LRIGAKKIQYFIDGSFFTSLPLFLPSVSNPSLSLRAACIILMVHAARPLDSPLIGATQTPKRKKVKKVLAALIY